MFESTGELRAFIASLRIPEPRRAVLEVELLDHLESRIAAALAAGTDQVQAEHEALAALGDPDQLRASLERIEPGFAIEWRHATARGLASALAAAAVFAVVGALVQRSGSYPVDLGLAAATAVLGLGVLWLFAPRGIGVAVLAEARASIELRTPASPRGRAVAGYLGSLIAVFMAVFAGFVAGVIPEAVSNDVLAPAAFIGLGYGSYALHVMRRARRERALLRADHGA